MNTNTTVNESLPTASLLTEATGLTAQSAFPVHAGECYSERPGDFLKIIRGDHRKHPGARHGSRTMNVLVTGEERGVVRPQPSPRRTVRGVATWVPRTGKVER